MKAFLQQIKGLWGKINIRKVSYAKPGARPVRDWNILLSTTFFLLLISAFLAFYFFNQINAGTLFVVSPSDANKNIVLDNKLLKKTVDEINERQTFFDAVKSGSITHPDPSI